MRAPSRDYDPEQAVAGDAADLYREEDRFIETYWGTSSGATYFLVDAARRDEDGTSGSSGASTT